MANDKLSLDERFFLKHGGYSWDPATETQEAGRLRCARESAQAEAKARELGWSYGLDRDYEQYAWQGGCFDVITRSSKVAHNAKRYDGYTVTVYDAEGVPLASLGGITFKDNDPHADSYLRVVQAQLAEEALAVRV